jgi:hypothetical protein
LKLGLSNGGYCSEVAIYTAMTVYNVPFKKQILTINSILASSTYFKMFQKKFYLALPEFPSKSLTASAELEMELQWQHELL